MTILGYLLNELNMFGKWGSQNYQPGEIDKCGLLVIFLQVYVSLAGPAMNGSVHFISLVFSLL